MLTSSPGDDVVLGWFRTAIRRAAHVGFQKRITGIGNRRQRRRISTVRGILGDKSFGRFHRRNMRPIIY